MGLHTVADTGDVSAEFAWIGGMIGPPNCARTSLRASILGKRSYGGSASFVSRWGEDFVVVSLAEDLVVFRNSDAGALRKVCRSLRWDIAIDSSLSADQLLGVV
jgi:hypothetical protein